MAGAVRYLQLAACFASATSSLPRVPSEPTVRIESFSAGMPYTVGTEPVSVSLSVRNSGAQSTVAGTGSVRIFCLSGLDYTEGDTNPVVPSMSPGATVRFTWRLQPSTSTAPLVVMAALYSGSGLPLCRVLTIQRLVEIPSSARVSPSASPAARMGPGWAAAANDRIMVRVIASLSHVPIVLISVHMPGGWQNSAVSAPIVEAMYGEPGQVGWWQMFHASDLSVTQRSQRASITVSGELGAGVRATVTLTVDRGSSAIECTVSASPLRPISCSAIRICGVQQVSSSDGASVHVLGPVSRGAGTVEASWSRGITIGSVWGSHALPAGWELVPQDISGVFSMLRAEWRPGSQAATVERGALVRLHARLVALWPSRTVEDALQFAALPRASVKPAAIKKGVVR